jgi:hypothetical protein
MKRTRPQPQLGQRIRWTSRTAKADINHEGVVVAARMMVTIGRLPYQGQYTSAWVWQPGSWRTLYGRKRRHGRTQAPDGRHGYLVWEYSGTGCVGRFWCPQKWEACEDRAAGRSER